MGGSIADIHSSQRNTRHAHNTKLRPAPQQPKIRVCNHLPAAGGHTWGSTASCLWTNTGQHSQRTTNSLGRRALQQPRAHLKKDLRPELCHVASQPARSLSMLRVERTKSSANRRSDRAMCSKQWQHHGQQWQRSNQAQAHSQATVPTRPRLAARRPAIPTARGNRPHRSTILVTPDG